jgi:hypothetical protein
MAELKLKTQVEDIGSEEVEEVKKPEPTEKAPHIYSDPLFEALKRVLVEDVDARTKGIKFNQYNNGTKIVIYQGNPRNVWGFVDVVNWIKGKEPVYDKRIYNSILKRILKKNELTKKYFEDLV